ncbi:MAG: hypothetical protein LPK09_05685 [Hymenobacteraceae bacterium]|nr:hypothetical protein [Hymenobacteraceae bacterium]
MAPKTIHRKINLQEPIQLRHMMGDVYVTIQQKEDYIEAKWSGHITADDVVSAALAYLELVSSSGCPRLLNDKSDVTGDWQEANDWLQFEWAPKAMAAGLRYLAHVYSQNMFSRLAARELQERISSEFCMKNFQERQEAERWLVSHGNTGAAGMRTAKA